jgi:hypothetical protein
MSLIEQLRDIVRELTENADALEAQRINYNVARERVRDSAAELAQLAN